MKHVYFYAYVAVVASLCLPRTLLSFQIVVELPNVKPGHVYDVSDRTTISELKKRIFERENIPTYEQKIMFGAKFISESDSRTLLIDIGIEKNAILEVQLGLKGGGVHFDDVSDKEMVQDYSSYAVMQTYVGRTPRGRCGATLITEDGWVLTAAHCLSPLIEGDDTKDVPCKEDGNECRKITRMDKNIKNTGWGVTLTFALNDCEDPLASEKTIPVQDVVFHKSFKAESIPREYRRNLVSFQHSHDIALLKIKNGPKFRNMRRKFFLRPLSMTEDMQNIPIGTHVRTIGWGDMENKFRQKTCCLFGTTKVVSPYDKNPKCPRHPSGPEIVPPSHLRKGTLRLHSFEDQNRAFVLKSTPRDDDGRLMMNSGGDSGGPALFIGTGGRPSYAIGGVLSTAKIADGQNANGRRWAPDVTESGEAVYTSVLPNSPMREWAEKIMTEYAKATRRKTTKQGENVSGGGTGDGTQQRGPTGHKSLFESFLGFLGGGGGDNKKAQSKDGRKKGGLRNVRGKSHGAVDSSSAEGKNEGDGGVVNTIAHAREMGVPGVLSPHPGVAGQKSGE